jgi:TonB family protein
MTRKNLIALLVLFSGCATDSNHPTTYEVVPGGRLMSNEELMTRRVNETSAENAIAQQKTITTAIPTDFDQPIVLLHSQMPEYPRDLQNAGVTGVVTVLFVVNEAGNVESVKVVESPDPRLSDACIKAIREWRFAPLTKDHKPTKAVFEQRIPFRL